MNFNLHEAPAETDVILYRNNGRPPIIAACFAGEWKTFDYDFTIGECYIAGWALIPE